MRLYKHLSVATKLVLVAIGSCCMAVLLCSAGYMYNEYNSLRANKVKQIQTISDMIEFNSAAALNFRRTDSARDLLESVRMDPSIVLACLYDAEGGLFASYQKDPQNPVEIPICPGEGYEFNRNGELLFFTPIVEDGSQIGTLYLVASTDEFYNQMGRYIRLAAIVMLVSLAGSVVVSVMMQRTITRPIVQLAATAHRVSSGGDYSIRVRVPSRDEIGRLYEAFNHMLQRVQDSEKALQNAYDELEDHVRERTCQLREEIQQRQRIQDELVFAIKAAEAASHAKSEFLANMSHEIRTPLNSILGFTDLLLRGADGGHAIARQEYLETIQTSGRHLLELINDILDLSKIEAGRMEIERSACSPHAIIAEVLSVARIAAVDKQLDLRYRWESRMPTTIETDPAKFRQLLLNVIGNAIKFTEEGGIAVRARLTDDEHPMLVVEVEDTGIGIPEEKLRRVFDPFVQADSSLTRRYGGTGLGLAICSRICTNLNGSLEVQSEVGTGSTFTITIDPGPLDGIELLDSPPSDATANHRLQQVEERDVDGLLRDRDILLVEDGVTNRKVIGLMLEEAGARVATAENGKIGVDLACSRPFDAILMDMQMPVMDGYRAARQLRDAGIDRPIIALTAHAMKGDAERCLDAGCSGYLSKPVEYETLIRTIGKALELAEPNKAHAPESESAASECPAGSPIRSLLPTANRAFGEIVIEFAEQLDKQIEAMSAAQDAADTQAMRRLAHWLRGTGGTAGFPQLSEWALRLSQAAHDGDWSKSERILVEIKLLAARIELPVIA